MIGELARRLASFVVFCCFDGFEANAIDLQFVGWMDGLSWLAGWLIGEIRNTSGHPIAFRLAGTLLNCPWTDVGARLSPVEWLAGWLASYSRWLVGCLARYS